MNSIHCEITDDKKCISTVSPLEKQIQEDEKNDEQVDKPDDDEESGKREDEARKVRI